MNSLLRAKLLISIEEFLVKANRYTYASNESKSELVPDLPGAICFSFKDGLFEYRDNYYGDSRFSGTEVVYFEGKAVWQLSYQGFIIHREYTPRQVYGFLKEALRQEYFDLPPVRGPRSYASADWDFVYENNIVEGYSLEWILGYETINGYGKNSSEVYKATYQGIFLR